LIKFSFCLQMIHCGEIAIDKGRLLYFSLCVRSLLLQSWFRIYLKKRILSENPFTLILNSINWWYVYNKNIIWLIYQEMQSAMRFILKIWIHNWTNCWLLFLLKNSFRIFTRQINDYEKCLCEREQSRLAIPAILRCPIVQDIRNQWN
jgi:hypothetical protein